MTTNQFAIVSNDTNETCSKIIINCVNNACNYVEQQRKDEHERNVAAHEIIEFCMKQNDTFAKYVCFICDDFYTV